MTKEQEKEFEQAIVQLSGDPRFDSFMSVVRENMDKALTEAVMNQSLMNAQVSAAYLGEVRAYKDILAIYDEGIKRRQNMTQTL